MWLIHQPNCEKTFPVRPTIIGIIDRGVQGPRDPAFPEAIFAEKEDGADRWGNNLGVRLPVAAAKAAKLSVDQRVRVSVEEGRVVITPIEGRALSLEQRLALFDPTRHGEEAMADGTTGSRCR